MSSTNKSHTFEDVKSQVPPMVPKGNLLHLSVDDIKPSINNPRRLFDPGPLKELKDSIRMHGVLVPITVYKLPGQKMYGIVDGERRYRCCVELREEGIEVEIPANIVDPPDKMASLIYMFNIHSFREQWELMPTALSLKIVIEDLGTEDSEQLHEITGLSIPQIERCKIILNFPEKYQQLSLDSDSKKRIPSNFWVELYPVLNITMDETPDLYGEYGRDGITDIFIDKYQNKKIKSILHLRRIMEAFEVAEEEIDRVAVADRLREYLLTPEMETRSAFDGFIRDQRRIQRAVGACTQFINDITKAKIDYSIDGKDDLIYHLLEVVQFAENLIEKLSGDDPPTEEDNTISNIAD